MLGNLRIRNKLLLAFLPLGAFVLVAVGYANFRMRQADARYTVLVDQRAKDVRNLVAAGDLSNRFASQIYREIATLDPIARRNIDADLDQIVLEARSSLSQALQENPSDADTIKSAATQFNQAVSWSEEARAAALRGDSHTATSRMQSQVEPQLTMVHQEIENLVGTLDQSIDKESDGLTEKMYRSIVLSWLFALLGLLVTSGFALYIVQIELVKPLEKFRLCILEVAGRRFEGPKAR